MPKENKPNKKFWSVANNGQDTAELLIHGEIADDSWWDEAGSKEFAADMLSLRGNPIKVRINSLGGSLFAGQAMYAAIKQHDKHVTTYIDGVAASAATFPAIAGDTVIMPANAMFMIHNPSTGAWGNSNDFRKAADDLDKIRESMVSAYQDKTGLERDEIIKMLDEEEWLTASRAKELGFIDEIETSMNIAASLSGKNMIVNGVEFSMDRFKTIPTSLVQAAATKPKPEKPQKPNAGTDNAASTTEDVMDIETLKAKHPDLYAQVTDAGVKAGVDQERNRIKAIEEMAMPGHDEMVNKAKFDSGISAEALAVEIVKAEKQRGKKFLDQREEDANNLSDVEQEEPETNVSASADDEKRNKWRAAAKRAGRKS
tara:strand:- start:15178 stop:16290 length:1113 start_codon:yes stop_codon:yes gene_type:complete